MRDLHGAVLCPLQQLHSPEIAVWPSKEQKKFAISFGTPRSEQKRLFLQPGRKYAQLSTYMQMAEPCCKAEVASGTLATQGINMTRQTQRII